MSSTKSIKKVIKAIGFDLAFWAITAAHIIDGSI
jgi:hypothetical protein